jgi:hypothetical protein
VKLGNNNSSFAPESWITKLGPWGVAAVLVGSVLAAAMQFALSYKLIRAVAETGKTGESSGGHQNDLHLIVENDAAKDRESAGASSPPVR